MAEAVLACSPAGGGCWVATVGDCRGDPCKTPRASKTPHGLFSETIDHFSFFNIPRYQTNKEGSSDAMGWLFLFVGPCYPLKRVFGGFLKYFAVLLFKTVIASRLYVYECQSK